MRLADILYHPCPTPEFIGDSLVQDRNTHPTIRGQDMKLCREKPVFVLMRLSRQIRKFDARNDAHLSTALCYDFVLVDGSFVCFPARLNSGLSKKLAGVNLQPGSSITVLDHDMVWLRPTGSSQVDADRRMVMFIKDFTWKEAPAVDTGKDPHAIEAQHWFEEGQFVKSLFDMEVAEECHKTKTLQFYNYCVSENHGWVWTFLPDKSIKKGHWLHTEENKRLWQGRMQEKKRKYDSDRGTQRTPPSLTISRHA